MGFFGHIIIISSAAAALEKGLEPAHVADFLRSAWKPTHDIAADAALMADLQTDPSVPKATAKAVLLMTGHPRRQWQPRHLWRNRWQRSNAKRVRRPSEQQQEQQYQQSRLVQHTVTELLHPTHHLKDHQSILEADNASRCHMVQQAQGTEPRLRKMHEGRPPAAPTPLYMEPRRRWREWQGIGASATVLHWLRRGVTLQWNERPPPPYVVPPIPIEERDREWLEAEIQTNINRGSWIEVTQRPRWCAPAFVHTPSGFSSKWHLVICFRHI